MPKELPKALHVKKSKAELEALLARMVADGGYSQNDIDNINRKIRKRQKHGDRLTDNDVRNGLSETFGNKEKEKKPKTPKRRR